LPLQSAEAVVMTLSFFNDFITASIGTIKLREPWENMLRADDIVNLFKESVK
jgi:hypothetical protein